MAKSYTHLRRFLTSRAGSITSSSYLNPTVWAYRHCLIDKWLKCNPAKDHLTDKHDIVFEVGVLHSLGYPKTCTFFDLSYIFITVRGEPLTNSGMSHWRTFRNFTHRAWPIWDWSNHDLFWIIADPGCQKRTTLSLESIRTIPFEAGTSYVKIPEWG